MLWRPYSVLIALIFLLEPVLGQCYFPSGDVAQDHITCSPFAVTSLCCPQGWTCFSGGICVITDLSKYPSGLSIGATIRGSCTNPKWDRSACGDVCLKDQHPYDRGQLTSCGNNRWCCAPDVANGSCDCKTGDGAFSFDGGTAQTIIGVTGSALTHTATVAPSSTQDASSTSATSKSSTTTGSCPAQPPATYSGSNPPPTPSCTPKKQATTNTTAFRVGVGVGAAVVGAALTFALVWIFIHRPRLRRSQHTSLPPGVPPPPPIPERSPRRKESPVPSSEPQWSPGVPMWVHEVTPDPPNGVELREQYVSPPRRDDAPSARTSAHYSFEFPGDQRV